MTRMDSVRAATGTARDSVRHAAEVVAPYAETAKETAAHYAHEAGARLGPRMSYAARRARRTARVQYDTHLVPRLSHVREALPPSVDQAAVRTRRAARQAVGYAGPRFEAAREVAGPVRAEAASRSAAALAALRGEVTPAEINKVLYRRRRRARTTRFVKRLTATSVAVSGVVVAWRWWQKQTSPDWLVEPPAATEVGDRSALTSVDGSGPRDAMLDPEVEAKQARTESSESDDQP